MFSTLRDSFRFVGKKTTVGKLRDALSSEANEEIYNNYRMLYVGFLTEYKEGEKQIKDMQQRIKNLKKMIDKTSKKEENDRLLNQLKEQMSYYDTKKQNIVTQRIF